MRIARLGPLAETGAAAGRAMPPLEHVAFAELLARVQHDLRPRQPRFEERKRQHVLQLVAIAGRAAELVRAHTAEQPRRVKLVGQPGVDQPVEVRPVGAHLDLAQPLGPGGARRRKFVFSARDADARRGGKRFLPARRLAEGDRDLCFAARRQHDLAAEGGHAPSVVARGAVARASLDHRGREDIASGPAEESRADGLGRWSLEARRGESEAAHEIVVRVAEEKSRANRLVDNLVDARVGAVLEREIEEGRDAQALWVRPAIAQGQETHVARIVRRHEDDIFRLEIAARRGERRDSGLIDGIVGRVLALKWREARRVGLAACRGRADRRSAPAARPSRCRNEKRRARSGGRCRRRRRSRRRWRPSSPCRVRSPSHAPMVGACDG